MDVKKEDIEYSPKKPKKKKKIARIIINTITLIFVLVIIAEVAVGIINMQRISNKEEPVWYLTTKTIEKDSKTITQYNLGLYRIVKTDTSKETKITLKPFFIGD